MTLRQAISQCDAVKPNQYTTAEKVRWLSRLDGRVQKEILDPHEPGKRKFAGYTEEDIDAQLLARSPYDEIYPLFLQSQVDYFNAEYARYNNSAELFNTAWTAYADHINRTRRPLGEHRMRV